MLAEDLLTLRAALNRGFQLGARSTLTVRHLVGVARDFALSCRVLRLLNQFFGGRRRLQRLLHLNLVEVRRLLLGLELRLAAHWRDDFLFLRGFAVH